MVENTDSSKVVIGQKEFRKIFYHLSMSAKKQNHKAVQDKDYANKEKTILSSKISELESKPEKDAWIKAKLEPKIVYDLKKKIVVVKRKPEDVAKRKEFFEVKKHLEVAKRNYELLKKKGISEEYLERARLMIGRLEESLEKLKRK